MKINFSQIINLNLRKLLLISMIILALIVVLASKEKSHLNLQIIITKFM